MEKELISVIVPVHNGQAYLKNCIDSIEAQSYDNLEVLVVNDGSTDQTAAVCDDLKKAYGNLRVFTLEDVGVSAARNFAISQAQGDSVTFVDADDRLCPGVLAHLQERMAATGSDLAGCRFVVWSTEEDWKGITQGRESKEAAAGMAAAGMAAGGAVADTAAAGTKEKCFDGRQYLTDCILQDNCRCWSKLYKRNLFTKAEFREGLTVGEDMLFLVDLLPFLRRAVETDYPGYGYYQNPAGVMQRPFTPAYMDQIRCWELAREEILKMDGGLESQMAAKIIIAVMLTVGKIAHCPKRERREASGYLARCRETLGEQMQVGGNAAYLPSGYAMKAKWFYRLPGLYVRCYGTLQSAKRRLSGRGMS